MFKLHYEVWKPVVGYEGFYEVSNYGRVKSINYNHTGTSKILRCAGDGNGYFKVILCKNGKSSRLVHRLVAEAFVPNPENLPVINHKDENKLNNCATNLEWCTRQYNVNYGTGMKRALETRKAKSTRTAPKEIVGVDIKTGETICFYSSEDAGRYLGDASKSSSIRACARGKLNTAYGFKWEYKNE